ncbi:MAG: DUF4256 domain-containing protein [Oscillospiraceae bacterium]
MNQKELTAESKDALLDTLKVRFEGNMRRHEGISWADVLSRLEASDDKLRSLREMEDTGGEPDIIGYDSAVKSFLFCDCSPESPAGRRNLCYDEAALESRKQNKPAGSAIEMAVSMGVELLDEEQYRQLQTLGEFDLKTSSWVLTPADVRALGGALFCDRRYDKVFTYHNGAESYYSSRGFRGLLLV